MLDYFRELDQRIGSAFISGDPEIRTWFLVEQSLLPFVLCGAYVLGVLFVGPAIMKNRKPLNLRTPMILFNLFLVITYATSLFIIITNLPRVGFTRFCKGGKVLKNDLSYTLTRCCWILYILKYVEFIDTIFFILRKKQHLITFLHVIHHTIVPLTGWVMLRTERSGFQSIPVMVNGCVHVIMYSYYALAAVGPQMKKYLWWKKYLTIIQMVQFIFFLIFVAVAPMTGCSIMKSSICLDVFGGVVFLILFYNFYKHNFTTERKLKDH